MFDFKDFFAAAGAQGRAQLTSVLKAGVDELAEGTIQRAQRLCPIDTGFLAASAAVRPAEVRGDEVVCELGFNAAYAAAVHERLDLRHAIGQAKFLEAALSDTGAKMGPFMAERAATVLQG